MSGRPLLGGSVGSIASHARDTPLIRPTKMSRLRARSSGDFSPSSAGSIFFHARGADETSFVNVSRSRATPGDVWLTASGLAGLCPLSRESELNMDVPE